MIDIDHEEQLVEKVGGKFKVTMLMQKRMLELTQGAKPLVNIEIKGGNSSSVPNRHDIIKIIVREILEEKISLAPAEDIRRSLLEGAKDDGEPKKTSPAHEFFGEEIKKMKKERLKELNTLLESEE